MGASSHPLQRDCSQQTIIPMPPGCVSVPVHANTCSHVLHWYRSCCVVCVSQVCMQHLDDREGTPVDRRASLAESCWSHS